MAKIIFFGKLADLVSEASFEYEVPKSIASIGELRNHFNEILKLGGALNDPCIRVAINGELITSNAFSSASEIAFLPPVGGG